ncbi:Carboxylesterase [Heterobasidion irregulare TC 32-1]|uniref:Carboxylic ester hydrolase n=1 Tax=Heterobasidion irregulare (strain TC 32-1) TaxID=747525 RepID=W4KE07_HETIT|nr:Carboxylesterase [Heterobasidion irregulare TC 32-1]ETW84092.1 Carboxylesterase [Heterobasidion irregulare TC 32-1]
MLTGVFTLCTADAAQPTNDGQAAGTPFEDKVGFGEASENPLFLNIVVPPSYPSSTQFPVRIYIHGGSVIRSRRLTKVSGFDYAQFIAAERSEVWVNIGYRLSAFGFLACDEPKIEGNFGFKDQWLALQWVKENINSFGGDANNIQVTGLSAGRKCTLPFGRLAVECHSVGFLFSFEEIHTAHFSQCLRSNPKTPQELRSQFEAICRALDLDPTSPDVLATIQDPSKVSFRSITKVIETEKLGLLGTFRGCLDGKWMSSSPDPMTWQRSGGLARGLLVHGVRSVVIGDLSEEWYLYSIAHPIEEKSDIVTNLNRYYSQDLTENMVKLYKDLPDNAGAQAFARQFGDILSDGQVHLPVRLLHRDLLSAGYPVLRYEIRWTPEQIRPKGFVTHATDRVLWAFRVPVLQSSQVEVAKAWLRIIAAELQKLETEGKSSRGVKEILTLREDKTIQWMEDGRWDGVIKKAKAFPGEARP